MFGMTSVFLRLADVFGFLLSFHFSKQRLCHSDDDSAKETGRVEPVNLTIEIILHLVSAQFL